VVELVNDIKNKHELENTKDTLKKKLHGQRKFLNMVVHDLRNPCESIHHGLEYVINIFETEMNDIFNEIIDEIEQFDMQDFSLH
jgi:signal transduction histidine kinase